MIEMRGSASGHRSSLSGSCVALNSLLFKQLTRVFSLNKHLPSGLQNTPFSSNKAMASAAASWRLP
jgi:hypothetical protein